MYTTDISIRNGDMDFIQIHQIEPICHPFWLKASRDFGGWDPRLTPFFHAGEGVGGPEHLRFETDMTDTSAVFFFSDFNDLSCMIQ